MNKEIEEILNELKNQIAYVENLNENADDDIYICKNNVIKLLDYITNLLTDNKRLQHNEKVFKGRNEKAIEYLGINEEILETCEIYDVNGIEVYKILQGSDKE